MHEIDLIGIDVDRDIGPELEIEPGPVPCGEEFLIGALGKVARGLIDQHARHPVDMGAGLDPVIAAEQAGEAGMGDFDVEPVRIIVGDVLPVDVARPRRDPSDRLQSLEIVRADLGLIGRHHLGDAWGPRFEPDEQEAAPILHFDWNQAERGRIEPRIVLPGRHADEAPVGGIGPGVIRASQPLRAARMAIDQPRAAVAADVGEGARYPIVAADDEDALAQYLKRPPVAGARDIAGVTDDLPAGADQPRHFEAEIFGIAVDPAGQAQILLVVGLAARQSGDVGHGRSLAWRRKVAPDDFP